MVNKFSKASCKNYVWRVGGCRLRKLCNPMKCTEYEASARPAKGVESNSGLAIPAPCDSGQEIPHGRRPENFFPEILYHPLWPSPPPVNFVRLGMKKKDMVNMKEENMRETVTAQITRVDKTFLKEAVKNKDVMSKSELVRKGLELARKEKGYSEKTGLKEAGA